MENLIDELLKASLSCIGFFGKNEEWKEINVNKVKNELKMVNTKDVMNDKKTYTFSDGQKKDLSTKLVIEYPESLLNVNMIDIDSRNIQNEVEIDFQMKYLDKIIKYMTKEYDIMELNGIEFVEFCRELMEMNIPFRMDIMNRLFNGSNEYGIGWKNRCFLLNNKESLLIKDCRLLKMNQVTYKEESEQVYCMIEREYESIIQSFSTYLLDPSKGDELRLKMSRELLNSFLDHYSLDMTREEFQSFFYPIYSPFLKESIINIQYYDSYLKEWCGDHQWKLIYRASEHGYTAKSFHQYCDDQGPTLVIIKSREGNIFGGYTTQSWRGDCIYSTTIHHQ